MACSHVWPPWRRDSCHSCEASRHFSLKPDVLDCALGGASPHPGTCTSADTQTRTRPLVVEARRRECQTAFTKPDFPPRAERGHANPASSHNACDTYGCRATAPRRPQVFPLCVERSDRPPQPHTQRARPVTHSGRTTRSTPPPPHLLVSLTPLPMAHTWAACQRPTVHTWHVSSRRNLHTAFSISGASRRRAASQRRSPTLSCELFIYF